MQDISVLIFEAARMATESAMKGIPIKVYWIPPVCGADDPDGMFASVPYDTQLSGSDTPPWER